MKQEQKKIVIEQLKKNPIIQLVAERSGISRATFYRWQKEDADFAKEADEAIKEGPAFVSDIAEGQLLSAIKDKNMTAIIFWLKNRHAAYMTRVEVNASIKQIAEKLTPEQESIVREALRLAALSDSGISDQQNNGTDNN